MLALDTWYQVDCKFDMSTGTVTSNALVNDTACPQASVVNVAGTYSTWKLGPNSQTSTMTMYLDELQLSATAADYPFPYADVAWIGA